MNNVPTQRANLHKETHGWKEMIMIITSKTNSFIHKQKLKESLWKNYFLLLQKKHVHFVLATSACLVCSVPSYRSPVFSYIPSSWIYFNIPDLRKLCAKKQFVFSPLISTFTFFKCVWNIYSKSKKVYVGYRQCHIHKAVKTMLWV